MVVRQEAARNPDALSVLSPRRGGSKLRSMRRATLVLASSLAAAAIAGVFLYRPGSSLDRLGSVPASSAVEVVPPQATQPQSASLAESEPNVPGPGPTGDAVARDARGADPPAYDRAIRRRGPPRDEATVLADLRKIANQDIQQSYSLLFDDLELTPQQRQDLIAVLVELQVESAWSGSGDGGFEKRGRTIGAQERHERISAAIGDEKLDEFLLLEVNSAAYWETQEITSLLRRKQVPLTEEQRDGVFEILVEVRDRYPPTAPDADSESFEYIEQQLAQMDDFDRHIVELAPSVLSATQVAHLSDEYQWMARQRVDSVEMQKKRRAERSDDGIGWSYPARWNPH